MVALQQKVDQLIAVKDNYPGAFELIKTAKNILPPANLSVPFSAREYVQKAHGRKLTSAECRSLGRFASNAFTTLKLDIPEKYGTSNVYWLPDLPAWNVVYAAWLVFTKQAAA